MDQDQQKYLDGQLDEFASKVDDLPESEVPAGMDRKKLLGVIGAGGAALSLPALLAACGGSSNSSSSSSGVGNYPTTPKWKWVFVNHVTTNPFFVPTQYGIEDAGAIFNTTHQWTGSENSDVSEMVSAMNTAIAAKADGIAVCLIDAHAFNAPTKKALDAGIPVIAYNADAPAGSGNERLAYIGQDLFVSGQKMGEKIVELIPSGDVVGFIATPGVAEHPAADRRREAGDQGLRQADQLHAGRDRRPGERGAVRRSTPTTRVTRDLKGMFAVDAGSTQGVAQVMQKYNLPVEGDPRRRVRPPADDPEPDQQGLPGLHDRPAALPAGVLPGGAALPVQDLGWPDGAFRHEHGSAVRHEGQRQAVPDHQDPLRRELELSAIRDVDLAPEPEVLGRWR